MTPITETDFDTKITAARETLDAWTRQMVEWHFNPETGCPFWLDYASKLGWDPRREIRSYDDLDRLGPFQDEWLRGGPVTRWVPRGLAGKPIYVFETGGSTGVPKSRIPCSGGYVPLNSVACDTVVIGACAYARVNTIAPRAKASSSGVRARVDPRKPMRSARVVSSVIRRILG